MDGVVDGWLMATMSQQGCDVSKEVAEFWAGIMGRELVGPFRAPEGVKMTSAKYIEFLTDHFLPWFKRKGVPSLAKSSSYPNLACWTRLGTP